MKNEILNFMKQRPSVIGIIGYGSGINPQAGQENRKAQIDLIVIVSDIKKWHMENMKLNVKDYSFSSRLFFKLASRNKLRSGAGICYMTYLPFNGNEYKIGTIEKKDFLDDLNNYKTFYMAGRMQKPILIVKADNDIKKAIECNRKAGFLATKLLLGPGKYEEEYFYSVLAGLSYVGDTRMGIAENPNKVMNIVKGRFDFYHDVYGSLLNFKNGKVVIDDINGKLPSELDSFLHSSNDVREFFVTKNKSHSISQTIKGLFTTGLFKSVKYVLAKFKRRTGK